MDVISAPPMDWGLCWCLAAVLATMVSASENGCCTPEPSTQPKSPEGTPSCCESPPDLGRKRPNIVVILADDLGWNDVSFHGSNQFMTPNIDALAFSGVILRDYYTQPICTPARAALLTGRHPIHNGMEHDVLYAAQPWGLPLSESLMPQYLRQLGYTTHAVGKWHLGFFRTDYTPTKRGFQSHFGPWLGEQNHFTHKKSSLGMENDVLYAQEPWGVPLRERLMPQYFRQIGYQTHAVGKWHLGFFKSDYTPTRRGFDSHFGLWLGQQNHFTHESTEGNTGYDFRKDLDVFWGAKGKYAADLFTEEAERIIEGHNVTTCPLFLYVAHIAPHAPLQAPQETINRFQYIKDGKRQTFAAMVTKVDESVGRIVQALKNKGMLDNSIILFMSDNGGATHGFNGNVASNYPLRGGKDTLWEGGVRGVGLVWSPLLQNVPRVHRGLVNVQDWLPTLLTAIGADDHKPDCLDGVSQWAALDGRTPPPYSRMLHNIDPVRKIAAIRYQQWKLVVGRTYNGLYDGHYGYLTEEVPYDPEAVKGSPAGQAVSTVPNDALVTALRLDATINCHTLAQTDTSEPHVVRVRQAGSQKHGTEKSKTMNASECQPQVAPCLFDVDADPCETRNLAASRPEVVLQLQEMLMEYSLAKPNNQAADSRSLPENWNKTWVPWQDFVPPLTRQIF